jgi:thiamine biosynthesis lipoprotein
MVIGGDIALGSPPPGRAVASRNLSRSSIQSETRQTVILSHAGVSTSGDAEQFVEISGKRYSHIIDPHTGMALLGNRSVTIVAANATASDALATALCVMGPKAGLRFIQSQPKVKALSLEITNGKIREYSSKRWGTQEIQE